MATHRLLHVALIAAGLSLLLGMSPALAQRPGKAGDFDYVVLPLSWSPQACAAKGKGAAPSECGSGKNFGFVARGLRPYFAPGGYPANCGAVAAIPDRVVEAIQAITPDSATIQQDWQVHGSCSGLTPDHYFADTMASWERVRLPDNLRYRDGAVSMGVSELESALLAANPQLTPDTMAITCDKGQVSEVLICLNGELEPRPCGRGVVNNCAPKARLSSR